MPQFRGEKRYVPIPQVGTSSAVSVLKLKAVLRISDTPQMPDLGLPPG